MRVEFELSPLFGRDLAETASPILLLSFCTHMGDSKLLPESQSQKHSFLELGNMIECIPYNLQTKAESQ